MIQIVGSYAKASLEINRVMIEIIRSSDKRPYDARGPGFYHSIGEILDHYDTAGLVWQDTFKHDQVRMTGNNWTVQYGNLQSRAAETDDWATGCDKIMKDQDLRNGSWTGPGGGDSKIRAQAWRATLPPGRGELRLGSDALISRERAVRRPTGTATGS